MIPSDFLQWIRFLQVPIHVDDLIHILDNAALQCCFIKNRQSQYVYANDNFIRLLGLSNLQQLRSKDDFDLYRNKRCAQVYRDHDQYILSEEKTLSVEETLYPKFNAPIIKTMQGKLYPAFDHSDTASYVLGVVSPSSHLLKLDLDTLHKLTKTEIDSLLIKARYNIQLNDMEHIHLSRMEIKTLIQLVQGKHAGEIADALALKQSTIESYLSNIKSKLSVSSKSELLECILRHKILEQVML